MDGDPNTRWCADNKGQQQWLQLDLGRVQPISRAVVQWEFPEKKYGFAVEGSADGKAWQPLPGTVRFVRVKTTALPDAKWASIREVQLFADDGKEIKNQRLAAGGAPSTAAFDDSAWRKLDVPHDWGIEGPFRDDLPGDTGKLPWKAIGWYRKHFTVPAADQGRRIFVDFDGAMANAQVWLNGELVGGARATSGRGPWRVVAVVTSPSPSFDKHRALSLEWHIRYPTGRRPRPRAIRGPAARVASLGGVLAGPKFADLDFDVFVAP